MFHVPEERRLTGGPYGTNYLSGNNGVFYARSGKVILKMIASDGEGWEHVSVSLNKQRCPTWEEMCFVKNLFWDEDDTVLQYHPAKDRYVDIHPHVLHLWRPAEEEIPLPRLELV